jgi:6,7-dimethyl-8-ribityllumazine synthase
MTTVTTTMVVSRGVTSGVPVVRGVGAGGGRRSLVRAGGSKKKKNDDDAPTKAPLPREYKHHSPGSVQETDDAVTFAHERAEEAEKWAKTNILHVGEGNSEPIRLGVCIGEFHNKLMDRMLEDARIAAIGMGSTIDKVVWVPGTYEAPLVVENMLQDPTLDAVVVIGYIEKGSTLHGQEMGSTFSIIAKQLELEYGKPVGMGIIGPGATAEQADQRVAYAGNAVRASIRMARTFTPAPEED